MDCSAVVAEAQRLLATGLHEIGFFHTAVTVGLFQHAENHADADVDVDVAGSVQRVKHQQVFALRVAVGHQVDGVHFFGCHGRQVAAPFVGFDQHFIGDDVQLLLDLSLHVFAVGQVRPDESQRASCRGADVYRVRCGGLVP